MGHRAGSRSPNRSLLAGKVLDDMGEPLIAVHACKGKARYRYYVSKALHEARSDSGMRIPARELESVVGETLIKAFADPFALAVRLGPIASEDIARIATMTVTSPATLTACLVEMVVVHDHRIEIACKAGGLAAQLGISAPVDAQPIVLGCDARLTRSGRVVKLVSSTGAPLRGSPDTALIRLIAKAHQWWAELRKGELTVKQFAIREGLQDSYVTRVLRLAFLAPARVEAVMAGRQSGAMTIGNLTLGTGISLRWYDQ